MRQSIVIVVAALLLTACGSQPAAPEQPAAGVEDRTGKAPAAEAQPVQPAPVDAFGIAALKDPKNILSKRSIYFDYDSYIVKDEFKPLLEAHAKFLVMNPKFKVLLQGNADERGSREYNLALGQKRADAVKKALALLGVRDEQLEAVSLGKEKPQCTESNEACWAKNRRGDILHSAAREF